MTVPFYIAIAFNLLLKLLTFVSEPPQLHYKLSEVELLSCFRHTCVVLQLTMVSGSALIAATYGRLSPSSRWNANVRKYRCVEGLFIGR